MLTTNQKSQETTEMHHLKSGHPSLGLLQVSALTVQLRKHGGAPPPLPGQQVHRLPWTGVHRESAPCCSQRCDLEGYVLLNLC